MKLLVILNKVNNIGKSGKKIKNRYLRTIDTNLVFLKASPKSPGFKKLSI